MKRGTIWVLGAIMSIAFLVLLFMQINYMSRFVDLRKSQFDEIAMRSLNQATANVELNESRMYLENMVITNLEDSLGSTFDRAVVSNPVQGRTKGLVQDEEMRHALVADEVRKMYVSRRAMLNKVVYQMVEAGRDRPVVSRLDFSVLDQELKAALVANGINLPYHIRVLAAGGRELYKCADYEPGEGKVYAKKVYSNTPDSQNAVVELSLPSYGVFMTDSIDLIFPSVAFTMVLLIIFILTIYLIFRQKRLSEIKSDFISNMTHEFKTPISTISLAAQMLSDDSVPKTPELVKRMSGVINDETKRLRFQVDKVLQMSMFERQETTLRKVEKDCNKLIDGVVNTFEIKVGKIGGTLISHLDAEHSLVSVDEMHFTNVVFNLMDNAIKYRKENEPLQITVYTANVGNNMLQITVEDNGIGIRKEDSKHVFDRFFRVHTGNVHNVKGFGLGLAYVYKIVTEHGATIKCDSQFGKGTKFIITIPIVKK